MKKDDVNGDGLTLISSEKFKEFGAHAHRYYKIEHSFYKNKVDEELLARIWDVYWMQSLQSSPLLTNQDTYNLQVKNVVQKLKVFQDN